MVKQFGSHFAHSWNSYVQDVTKAEDELETEFLYRLDKLKRKNEGQARQINLHVKQLNAQALVIAGLEQDKQDLMDRVARTETKLREGSERLQKLDEKCRLYKDRLNAAVGEHQQLYSRSKKLCKDTIDQMRAEEQLQRSSNDLARQKAESLREHMLEKVRLVVAQSKAETRHMTDRIQALSQEIGDRESQIQRERERSERLLKQLDEQREAHKSFQLLQVKTESILDKMDEHHTLHAQGVKVAHDSSRTKLDAVIEHLESLSKLIIPHSDALSKLSNHQQEGISKVVAGLEAIINSQANGRESVERLSTDLKSHVDEMWQKLETREDALTQQLSEKRGENALVTRVMEEREVEFQALEAQLEEANEGSRVQEDRIRQLTARVTELETAPPVDSEEMLRLKSLEDENSNIKCELAVKGALIADLQSKLRDKDKEGMAEAKKFNDDISKLSQLMHDQQLAGRAATGQAVENARHRLRLEMEGMHQETRNSLRLAEKQRLNLQVQLQDTMAKLATTDQRLCHDSARMISLQESLAAAESRINQLTEEAQTRAEAVNPQQKAAELAVDEMGKGLLGNLGRWTQARGINGAITHDLEKLFSHCIGTADVGRKLHDFLENALADRVPQPNGPPVRPHTGSGSPNTSAPSNERLAQEQDAENHLPISLSIGSEMDRNQNAKGSVSEASGSIAAREEDMPSSNAPSDQPMSRPGEEGLISQEPERRVVVQSPNIAQVMPVSLSVEQEKARRREVTQLKSIIKTRQESDGDIIQDSSQEKGSAGGVIPDIGSFLRGPYNRPVAGYSGRLNEKFPLAAHVPPRSIGEDQAILGWQRSPLPCRR
ncbi:hypothetical protein QBC33DRAFT_554970 [Phialemonium atrogriseum]|uniref:Uncharacterized protein n=1 Tax=Phialemonium atrogriseum TaxID=1093897 RepID=A0AAJ0FL53_9PEZI|nr:uncharacterized protein QBC33DRAFT_554970 [Phialemonium atrogriseum]KAK1771807.1 hypothetical protein QBC33DRAFT_554970 [Phialemonium atrogriseum]